MLEDSNTTDNEIETLENYNNDEVASIIGDMLKDTVSRVKSIDYKEDVEFVRNSDMTRQCPKCDKKFGWLADLHDI